MKLRRAISFMFALVLMIICTWVMPVQAEEGNVERETWVGFEQTEDNILLVGEGMELGAEVYITDYDAGSSTVYPPALCCNEIFNLPYRNR